MRIPVPPNVEIMNFLLLVRVLEQFKNAGVKPLGVRDGICARKDRRRSQSKAYLQFKTLFIATFKEAEMIGQTWVAM